MLKGGPGIHGDFLLFLLGLRAWLWETGCLVVVVGREQRQTWMAGCCVAQRRVDTSESLHPRRLLQKPKRVILEAGDDLVRKISHAWSQPENAYGFMTEKSVWLWFTFKNSRYYHVLVFPVFQTLSQTPSQTPSMHCPIWEGPRNMGDKNAEIWIIVSLLFTCMSSDKLLTISVS